MYLKPSKSKLAIRIKEMAVLVILVVFWALSGGNSGEGFDG